MSSIMFASTVKHRLCLLLTLRVCARVLALDTSCGFSCIKTCFQTLPLCFVHLHWEPVLISNILIEVESGI